MSLVDVFFLVLAVVTVVPAFVVAFSRNLVYAAFALLFTFCGTAGLYGFLAADFLAILQILIYVGGILVLILFGVLFTQRIYSPSTGAGIRTSLAGLALGAILFCLLFLVLGLGFSWNIVENFSAEPTVHGLGQLLLSRHLLPFELASVLLLVVLIGAVAIARKELE